MKILFVDPSLRSTGIFARSEDNHASDTFTTKADHLEALGDIWIWANSLAENMDALVIEDYAFSRASQSVSKNGEVGGIIRGAFSSRGKPVVEVGISTWKSIVGIRLKKTTANEKARYIETVADKYGLKLRSTDACDAYLLYVACKAILDKTTKETESIERLRGRLLKAGIEKL